MASYYKDDADFRAKNGLSPNSSSSSSGSSSSSSSKSSSGSKSSSSSGVSYNDITKTADGYAYEDKHGYTHVVSDYNTAKDYSGDGNVYNYTGNYKGGYGYNLDGQRLNLAIPGAVSFGNGKNDAYGGSDYLGGIASAPTQSKTAYANYVANAAPSATNALMSQYQPANSASDYLNKNWQGGLDSYVNSQINRYNQALSSGDTGLISRLQSDAARVGYSLPTPQTASMVMPKVSMPYEEVTTPTPMLNQMQPFQYQSYQMPSNLPKLSSGGDTWTPTLAAKQQWYGQQDQLRNSYMDDWYKKQVLAQNQAGIDWEKQKYNDPSEQAKRDLELEYMKSQIVENNAQAAKAGRVTTGGAKKPTAAQTKAAQQSAAEDYMRQNSSKFNRAVDFVEQTRRNYEAGAIPKSTYDTVKKYYEDNYDPYDPIGK